MNGCLPACAFAAIFFICNNRILYNVTRCHPHTVPPRIGDVHSAATVGGNLEKI